MLGDEEGNNSGSTMFGSLALLAGYGLMVQNVMDVTSSTLYTRLWQVGGPWYLVGRDVMRGPLWAIHATYESLSPCCPRFHAETKPLLGRHPPQQWWQGGRVATPLRITKLGGRLGPLYPFSSRRSPSALSRIPIRAGRQPSIPRFPPAKRAPTHLPDWRTARSIDSRARRGMSCAARLRTRST